ncbi:MAG: AlbA family DNA-binding domain-containing protein [Gaiellaceae bacterium]
MSLLGPPLHELAIEDVERFLADAEGEPLLWEAKGTKLNKGAVRKAIGAFANGLETAYLILGAEETVDGWALSGFEFPDDPPAWVSAVVHDNLRPAPRVDVHTLAVGNGRSVAIVEVPPIATPPCVNQGSVFERVSGRTIPVEDPMRLAELYRRGQRARDGALGNSVAAAEHMIGERAFRPSRARFALAVSLAGHPPDIASRLFSHAYEESMTEIVGAQLVPRGPALPPGFAPTVTPTFGQSLRQLIIQDDHSAPSPQGWDVRVIWNGTAVIQYLTDAGTAFIDHLARGEVTEAWRAAYALVAGLGGYGPAYMELRLDGGQAIPAAGGGGPLQVSLGRGPLDGPAEDADFASVERELRRARGEAIYEEPQ